MRIHINNLNGVLKRMVLAFIAIPALTFTTFSQMSITGPACVVNGVQYAYTIAGPWNGLTNMQWSSSGTISGSWSGTPLIQIFVTFHNSGSVHVITSNPSGSATFNVSLYTGLSAGAITNPSQTINYNTFPVTLNCTSATVGGCSAPNFSYQWQSSPDNVIFTNISGATSLNLAFTSPLATTSYYRRFVKENTTGNTAYSNVATITVIPPTILPLVPGTVTPSSQFINYHSSATQLSSVGVSGGTGVFSYQWQSSANNVSWSDVPSTLTTYTPANLITTTYFRVAVTSYFTTAYSTSAVVNVYPQVTAGTITPSVINISSGGNPGIIGSSTSTGGNGTYSYQWQSSFNGVNFTNISAANKSYYLPGALSSNAWYRLMVTSNGMPAYSNIASVSINLSAPDLNSIRVRQILKAGVTDSAYAASLTSPYDVVQRTQYFDGLGRPIQTVDMKQSPLQKDIVNFNVYDAFGREMFKYLPFTSTTNDGNYKPTFQSDQYNFNTSQYPGEQFYYGQTAFEQSPFNRAASTFSPGISWIGASRGVSAQYQVNAIADSVIWNIVKTPGSTPTSTMMYPAGKLYKSSTIDEAGHSVVEYKDMEGQVVLKKGTVSLNPRHRTHRMALHLLCV